MCVWFLCRHYWGAYIPKTGVQAGALWDGGWPGQRSRAHQLLHQWTARSLHPDWHALYNTRPAELQLQHGRLRPGYPQKWCLTHRCQSFASLNSPLTLFFFLFSAARQVEEQVSDRRCQLGRHGDRGGTTQKPLSMSELMQWRHFSGDTPTFSDPYLDHARNHITFAFQTTISHTTQ